MSSNSLKVCHSILNEQEKSAAAKEAERLNLTHFGQGRYGRNGVITHKSDADSGRLQKLDKPIKKDEPQKSPVSKDEPKKKEPSKKPKEYKGGKGLLGDREDPLSDGEIKQKALDTGFKKTKDFKPAPGNAGSMANEIMSGEVSEILRSNPDMSDDELTMALYDQIKDTALGKQIAKKGGEAKTDRGAVPKGLNTQLYSVMRASALSGKQKHNRMKSAVKELNDSGKITPPAKLRSYYGSDVSLQKQKELIENNPGPFYTNRGEEIPKDRLIYFIENSGGGPNPSDTATIAIDSKGAGIVAFHSDKMSMADILSNTTPTSDAQMQIGFIDKIKASDEVKAKSKALIEKSVTDLNKIEAAFDDAAIPVAQELVKGDVGSIIDKIKQKPDVASRFIGGSKSVFVSRGKLHPNLAPYIDGDNPSEEEQLKGFFDYMADTDKAKAPTADMVKLISRIAKQNGVKTNFGAIRKRSIETQQKLVDDLNSTTVNYKGSKIGMGDYLEAKSLIKNLHLDAIDGKDADNEIMRYSGLVNVNHGGVVVEGEQLAKALGVNSTDDLMLKIEIGKPGEGQSVTKNKKTGEVTGRNIFIYAVDKDGKKIQIAYKTQRSKQGETGRTNNTIQYTKEMQQLLIDNNIQEQLELNEAKGDTTLSFWDIDETVFNTFAKIIVRDKETGKEIKQLTNSEFNSYKLKDNEEFDFSQFGDAKMFKDTSKVIKSTMNKIKKEYKDKNTIIFFLTARADFDSNAMFKDAFREQGLRVNDKRIRFELAGNLKKGTIADKKQYVMNKQIKRFNPTVVKIYDDHLDNVNVLDKLAMKYTNTRFEKYLIKNGAIQSKGKLNEGIMTFKQHKEEKQELEELFGAIPFTLDIQAWKRKHKGQKPKGVDDWKFDFMIPVLQAGQGFLDDGVFSHKGKFKDAVKKLVQYIKKRAQGGGNLKQTKVELQP